MTLLACTNEFALHFYQSIPQGLGGGRPTVATLVLNKEGVKFWNRIGWETLAGDEEAVRTGPVAILHQTDQELWLLRVNRERTDSAIPEWIAIQKSLVNGIACGCKNIQLPAQPKK